MNFDIKAQKVDIIWYYWPGHFIAGFNHCQDMTAFITFNAGNKLL